MKNQIRTTVVSLLIIAVFFTYITPFVVAEVEAGDPSKTDPGGPSDNQQQGMGNNTGHMGGPGGNQTGDQNQSGPGEPGYGDKNETTKDHNQYNYQTREMTIIGEGNSTRIRSQYRNNNTEETFEFYFNIDNAPLLQLSYIPTSQAFFQLPHFSLVIEQLLEYIDINANGKYDRNDVVLSTLVMSNATFANITYTNSTTPEGKTITILETHTLDTLFSIVIYVAREHTSLFNTILTPEEIKIDFNIVGYPFVNQTSQLALITVVETPFSITPEQTTSDEQKGRANQESGLNISSGAHRGFFSWANGATIDNLSRPVNVTVLTETEQTFTGDTQETMTQTQVIFSYPRGDVISHDPKIGVLDILQDIFPAVLQFEYLSALYVIACIVSATVFYGVIRFRKRH